MGNSWVNQIEWIGVVETDDGKVVATLPLSRLEEGKTVFTNVDAYKTPSRQLLYMNPTTKQALIFNLNRQDDNQKLAYYRFSKMRELVPVTTE